MRIDDLNLENYLRIACENFSFSTLTDVKEFIRFERVSDEVNYSTEQTSYFIDKVSIDEVKYEYFSGDEPLKNIKPRVLKNSSKAFCARARYVTFEYNFSIPTIFPSLQGFVKFKSSTPFWIVIPFVIFAFFGFSLAYILSLKGKNIRDTIQSFDDLRKENFTKNSIEEKLDTLKFKPHLIHTRTFPLFIPAITLFKTVVRRRVIILKCKS
jgi:hypothetical protein